jgi:hypothetical protein
MAKKEMNPTEFFINPAITRALVSTGDNRGNREKGSCVTMARSDQSHRIGAGRMGTVAD